MKTILNTVFRCEAAGRPNNEDNGWLCADLSKPDKEVFPNMEIKLGRLGTLLLVCDGMGGMEAGEVASAIAVDTIRTWFQPHKLTAEVLSYPEKYMKDAIVEADRNVKLYGEDHPQSKGLGSTIVMAWIIQQKVYVAWCGDSRAYRYHPNFGLERLSHDHSLVQSWVDQGMMTEEQAFVHPQGSIITRSLGDPNTIAEPDYASFDLRDGDLLLLCSDGLCGNLLDKDIEKEIAGNYASLEMCCQSLWTADENAKWHDNVTTAMAKITIKESSFPAVSLSPIAILACLLALSVALNGWFCFNPCCTNTDKIVMDSTRYNSIIDSIRSEQQQKDSLQTIVDSLNKEVENEIEKTKEMCDEDESEENSEKTDDEDTNLQENESADDTNGQADENKNVSEKNR